MYSNTHWRKRRKHCWNGLKLNYFERAPKTSEAYLEPCQTSKIECFMEIVTDL